MLLERELIRIVGRKNLPGRPLIYGTSKKFLEVFDLKDLDSLPKIKEIKALGTDESEQSSQVQQKIIIQEEPPGNGDKARQEAGPPPAEAGPPPEDESAREQHDQHPVHDDGALPVTEPETE